MRHPQAPSPERKVAVGLASSIPASKPVLPESSGPASGVARGSQRAVAGLHIREGEQSLSEVHPQSPLVRQAAPAASALHAELSVGLHSAQVFEGPIQRTRPSVRVAQCGSVTHSTQRSSLVGSIARRQWGRGSAQSVSITHTTQALRSPSHAPRGLTQAERIAVVHSTQRPARVPAVAHAGVEPEQSEPAGSQARHTCVTPSQMGVEPEQSAFVRQPTQTFIAVSQWALPVQCRSAVQGTHWPVRVPMVAHAGAEPMQSESEEQGWHALSVPQVGRVRGQSPVLTHSTQRPTLEPVAAQRGKSGSVQSIRSVAALHGRHTCAAESQMGRIGSRQSELLLQPVQVQVTVLQVGVGRRQLESELHCTHRPMLPVCVPHTGRAALGQSVACVAGAQERHERVAGSHTGSCVGQSELALQRHTPAVVSQTGALAGQLALGLPGMVALVRPAAVSRASGRQSLSLSVSR